MSVKYIWLGVKTLWKRKICLLYTSQLINIFAVVLFALLIYLLTKLIIEKNANAISMVKLLGYENREINSLYLTSTTWVVILSILLSLLLSTWTIYGIYGYLMSSFSGWRCV